MQYEASKVLPNTQSVEALQAFTGDLKKQIQKELSGKKLDFFEAKEPTRLIFSFSDKRILRLDVLSDGENYIVETTVRRPEIQDEKPWRSELAFGKKPHSTERPTREQIRKFAIGEASRGNSANIQFEVRVSKDELQAFIEDLVLVARTIEKELDE